MDYASLPLHINPIAFTIGPLSIKWYSLSYIAAILTVIALVGFRIRRGELQKNFPRVPSQDLFSTLVDAVLWAAIGMLLGARLGYVLFYGFSFYMNHPLSIFFPFNETSYQGIYGMSFHGGLIGAIVAATIFAKKKNLPFLNLVNSVIPAIPLGYFWGRIGNFLNGELYGRKTSSSLGMYFPDDSQNFRHPSQLYEAFGEGLLVFLILWPLRNKEQLRNKFLPIYLILYGTIRFVIEFTREPDPQIGLILGILSMGQILCLAMMVTGFTFLQLKEPKQGRRGYIF